MNVFAGNEQNKIYFQAVEGSVVLENVEVYGIEPWKNEFHFMVWWYRRKGNDKPVRKRTGFISIKTKGRNIGGIVIWKRALMLLHWENY